MPDLVADTYKKLGHYLTINFRLLGTINQFQPQLHAGTYLFFKQVPKYDEHF